MQFIRSILFITLFVLGNLANAQALRQFVVAPDVEIQYHNGELRFCERENLRGMVCGFEQKMFGKRRFAARNWWTAETFVQARTGLNEFTLWSVEPTADGRGVIVYYSE
jgi:hypothetical protein